MNNEEWKPLRAREHMYREYQDATGKNIREVRWADGMVWQIDLDALEKTSKEDAWIIDILDAAVGLIEDRLHAIPSERRKQFFARNIAAIIMEVLEARRIHSICTDETQIHPVAKRPA